MHLGLRFGNVITSKESLGAVRRTTVGGVIAAAPVGGARDQPVVEVVRGSEGAGPLCQVLLWFVWIQGRTLYSVGRWSSTLRVKILMGAVH
ncbi:uncharacterized protein DS421_17g584850 [Arachis hypogaea]|nr:uncharacterized protein DS421_17g584850 [Arachis hypogaea]